MKYSISNYVSAFIETVKKVPQEKAVEGLVKLLKKTGDIKHSKKILEAVHKKIVNEKGGKWINIEVARESALKKETFKHKFSDVAGHRLVPGKDHIDFQINPELVAGIRITIDGEKEFDNTMNNKLKRLFK